MTSASDAIESNGELDNEELAPGTTLPDPGCAQCGSETDWNGSSWCPDCGYYPGITDKYSVEEAVSEEVEAVEPEAPAPLIPIWGQLAMGGFALIVVISVIASNVFHYYGGDRGMWAIIQLVTGFAMLTGAQVLATINAMKVDSQLSFISGLTCPLDIWRHTFDSLPAGGRRIACAIWGITMATCALTVIGGIDFESLFDAEPVEKEDKTIVKRMMTAAAATAETAEEGDPENLEDAVAGFTDELVGDVVIGEGLPSNDKPLQCVVYGYMEDGKRDFGRVLLAAMINGRYEHVGEMEAGDLPLRVRARLGRTLKTIKAEAPICDSPFRGTWVDPSQMLDIAFGGWTVGGKMVNPEVAVETPAK